MARTGRPLTEINKNDFERLCGIQCTLLEMCEYFGITDKTLNSWCRRTYGKTFSEVFKQKRTLGMISLRRAQFELAKKNPAMAIFLGKNMLGQTDSPIATDTVPEALKITLEGHWDKVDRYFRNVENEENKGE